MEKKQLIKDLNPQDKVESIFLVKYIAMMESRDGKRYLNVILTDATGDIEARKWSGAEKIVEQITKGNYVAISGKINLYQGKQQLIISSIDKVDDNDINFDDYISKSENSPELMFNELDNIVDTLDDIYIKDLLKSIIYDSEISRRLKMWSAGKSIHHSYQGGLLEHILSCTKLASVLSGFYNVNYNFVIAGALLHDLCKIYELTDGTLVEYTEEGRLVGHLVGVIELFDKYVSRIKNFPHITKMHLKHILISHHGEYAFGSPKIPQTSEALLVHYIDLLDSKMASFECVKKTDKLTGHWSGFVKHLDRIIYKAELPTHKEYLKDDDKKSEKPQNERVSKNPSGELKQNLGGLLKDFKV